MDRVPISFKEILQNPSSVYDLPDEVLEDETLTEKQKREVLLQWKYDAILLQHCDEENMGGGEHSNLDRILRCLNSLEKPDDFFHS